MAVDARKIIADGDINALIDSAQKVGRDAAQKNLTTSQIRNIFGEVRQIEMAWDKDVNQAFRRTMLIKPKLAYQAMRPTKDKRDGINLLKETLTPCIDQIANATDEKVKTERFRRFVDFFEAILAYHKAAGGAE